MAESHARGGTRIALGAPAPQYSEGHMRGGSSVTARTSLIAAIILVLPVFALAACAAKAPPTLGTRVAENAQDVALDDPLEVTVNGAAFDRVMLERLDAPAPAPPFDLEPTRA